MTDGGNNRVDHGVQLIPSAIHQTQSCSAEEEARGSPELTPLGSIRLRSHIHYVDGSYLIYIKEKKKPRTAVDESMMDGGITLGGGSGQILSRFCFLAENFFN